MVLRKELERLKNSGALLFKGSAVFSADDREVFHAGSDVILYSLCGTVFETAHALDALDGSKRFGRGGIEGFPDAYQLVAVGIGAECVEGIVLLIESQNIQQGIGEGIDVVHRCFVLEGAKAFE